MPNSTLIRVSIGTDNRVKDAWGLLCCAFHVLFLGGAEIVSDLPNVQSEPRSYVARSVRSTIRDTYDRWLYCLVRLSFISVNVPTVWALHFTLVIHLAVFVSLRCQPRSLSWTPDERRLIPAFARLKPLKLNHRVLFHEAARHLENEVRKSIGCHIFLLSGLRKEALAAHSCLSLWYARKALGLFCVKRWRKTEA